MEYNTFLGERPAEMQGVFVAEKEKVMTEEMLEWVKGLIQDDNLHAFYTSPVWRRTQARILKENHYECSRCKVRGMVVQARTVHHKKYLRKFPELALEDENLEAICASCHYEEHHKKHRKFLNEERW